MDQRQKLHRMFLKKKSTIVSFSVFTSLDKEKGDKIF